MEDKPEKPSRGTLNNFMGNAICTGPLQKHMEHCQVYTLQMYTHTIVIQMVRHLTDGTRNVQRKSITILPRTVSEVITINDGSVCLTGQSKYSAPEDTGQYPGYP